MFFTFYPLATCVNCNSWVTVSSISPVLVLSGNVIFCPGMLAIHTIIRRLRHVLFFSALSHPLFVHLFVPPIPGSLLHCITPIIPSFHEVCLQRVRYSSVNVEWTNDWPTCCVSVFQNLVLPECFYSFVDVRKEFHKCCPNAGQVQDLTLPYILECKLELDEM